MIRGLLLPLDVVTILYVLFSGVYMCFGHASAEVLLTHWGIRLGILAMTFTLAVVDRSFSNYLVRFVRNLYPFLFVSFFYGETAIMKNVIIGQDLDPYIAAFEQNLFGCQPSVEFSLVMNQVWFGEMMSMFYFSYYIITGIVWVLFYVFNPKHSQRHIFVIVFSFYLFYVIFDIIPALGPQYYIPGAHLQINPDHFFGRLMHNLINGFEEPTGAFPSSHVGLAIIVSLLTWKNHRILFFCTLPFVIGICFATVYLREHYLTDVLAGALIAPMLYTVSNRVYYRLCRKSTLIDAPVD